MPRPAPQARLQGALDRLTVSAFPGPALSGPALSDRGPVR